ncbi:GHKL domain-containing protein [Pseudogracilibacillus auburnensis]|uniref:Two-component system sensor histidine kinase AgrC n=1 Tax=Pseudogracilibacillus auburnensis TaxID=1494959 RepID=A0A2V3VUS2_9BACI|nr:GHKL domain-containing protein [Pseudogracilibacillus auburnensis]PXW84814.1 two-component system sensor histidine kinase AgrC [Pseudogracilibacillus auburnensis]
MYIYDVFTIVIVGLSHIVFYLQLIQYERFTWKFLIVLSLLFTVLLGIIVTVTGYPEFNLIVSLIFLLALGLLRQKHGLTFSQNLYFALVSIVSITLLKMVFVQGLFQLFMLSPLNLYLWTASVLQLISVSIIFLLLILFQKQTRKLACFIVQSPFLFYLSYILLMLSTLILFILTIPTSSFLRTLHLNYGETTYIISVMLFLVLIILFSISSHLAKEKILDDQQQKLDKELLDYVEKLEVMHEELASFRHDYMNVLLSLHDGIRTKDLEQIETIYRDIIAPTSELINHREIELVKLSQIAIPEVKSMLSVKVIGAQQHDLSVLLDIPEKIDQIAMPLVPFIRAISILLDNAIEEAIISQERNVQIAFFEGEDIQRFIVRNSCSNQQLDVQEIYEKKHSSKGKKRGYGLFSLKQMITKIPNAQLETEFTSLYFTQIITLKK